MSENKQSKLSLDSADAAENALWHALGQADPSAEPSASLRRNFYRRLEQASAPGVVVRLREFLGFGTNAGWLTAAACLLAGLVTGQIMNSTDSSDRSRMAALEENVSILNRTLVLDRLNNDEPGKRLRGVIDAADLVTDDEAIAERLLHVAMSDRVDAIRSAAAESLGSRLTSPAMSAQLMEALQNAESPLVQLALIDLVLRNGNEQQLNQLLKLADDGALYPDLKRHVYSSLGRNAT